jgi:hypothetical protein
MACCARVGFDDRTSIAVNPLTEHHYRMTCCEDHNPCAVALIKREAHLFLSTRLSFASLPRCQTLLLSGL